jgi:hypothetical protein
MKKILTIACTAALLVSASSAQGSTVTFGSPLTATFAGASFTANGVLTNLALGEPGATAASPVTGAVVRWRILGATGGPFKLRILRPSAGGTYTLVGTSTPGIPNGLGIQTFSSSVPIQAGDLIGVENSNVGDEMGFGEVPGSLAAAIGPPPAEGTAAVPNTAGGAGQEVPLNADVQPLPAVAAVSPGSANFTGDTAVTILGSEFAAVTAVSFGGTPATFAVGSESQITAIAPAVTKPGKVDITVTTAGGKSAIVPGDQFVYKACVVPKLTGKKLKGAKRVLRKSKCGVGKVKLRHGASAKSAKVVKQRPKAERTLIPGAKIKVTLDG